MKIKNYPNQKNLIKALAQGLLSQQKKDGSFKTYFACDQDTGVDYYPGEAMFGLLEAYEFEKNKKYLESVKKAFAFYRRYWRKNKSAAFVPRHTQVYFKLYGYTQNKKLPAFVFEMNDWLIKNHQITKHKYKDLVGAFGKKRPDSLTSLYAEGINDAYALAVALKDKWRQSFYKEALRKASRFILLTQYKESNSFYLKGYDRAVGGFRRSLIVNELHSDDTQHALRALVKTVKNKIFR